MNLVGTCDFCGTSGKWEGGIFNSPPGIPGYDDPNSRPVGWAASYPVRPVAPDSAPLDWMSPENCQNAKLDMLLQCPACRGRIDIPLPKDTVAVADVPFEHSYMEDFECYVHRDTRKRVWQVFRHLKSRGGTDREPRTWMAVLDTPGRRGSIVTLNSAIESPDGEKQKDELYDVPSIDNPTPLLEAAAEMIKKG